MSLIELDIELFKELNKIPIKPFKKILKKYHKGYVKKDSGIYLRNFMFYFAEQISKESSEIFRKYNETRISKGLSKCYNLEIKFIKQAIEKIFIKIITEKLDVIGNSNTWNEALKKYEEIKLENEESELLDEMLFDCYGYNLP